MIFAPSNRQNGFTLMEILVVITLLGFTLVSTPFLSRTLLQSAVLNTTNTIAAGLRRAQIFSMEGRQHSNWGVYYTSGSLVVYSGNSYGTRTPALDQVTALNTNVSVSGFSDVNFASMTGFPSSTPIITISARNTTKTITINSEGMITK